MSKPSAYKGRVKRVEPKLKATGLLGLDNYPTKEQEVYFSEQLIQGALSLKTDIERMCQRYELGGIPPTERQVQMNIERMKIQYANTVLEAL